MLSQNEIEKYTEEWIEQDSKMAFTKLFEHYRKQLTEYAKTLTGNVDDANDLVQDVFLKLFKMKVENKNGGRFYCYAFLKNHKKIFMLSTEKQELIKHLLQADKETILGSIIHNFIDDINNKSDNDLLKLVAELKEANSHNSEMVKDILGASYEYVVNYQMPTDSAPTESEGLEAI